ncbi:MAG: RNA polymerase sigma factor [Gaiellaceae bacterium]
MHSSTNRPVSIRDLELVYRERYSRFLRVAVAVLGDVERGRDAVHETFVRSIRSRVDYRGEGSLEAWVWRTHVNVCLTEKRHRAFSLDCVPEAAIEDEIAHWPEVRAAIAALPERQRMTLFLRHYADLDYEEISSVLGVARGTVAATLHAAHSKLRDVLGEVAR